MQTIRDNIETMKGFIREMSLQTFKTPSQKCWANEFWYLFWIQLNDIEFCLIFIFSFTRKYGKTTHREYVAVPKGNTL